MARADWSKPGNVPMLPGDALVGCLRMLLEPEAESKEVWVNVTEAAEIIGYSRDHMQKLARDNWNLPPEERKMRVKRHSNGYMIWLPDIHKYIETAGVGPYKKREPVD
jgi:hypothetical protein